MEENSKITPEKVKEIEMKKSLHIFRTLLLATVLAVGVVCLGNCGSQGTSQETDGNSETAPVKGGGDDSGDNPNDDGSGVSANDPDSGDIGDGDDPANASDGSGNTADILTLQDAMLAASDALPDMTTVNSDTEGAEDLFSYLSDLDYEKVQSYFLSYSSEGLADEIAVIVLKDSSDLADAEASLEEHLDGRIKLYENYEPEQAARAKNAVVFTSGNCAALIMCDDADAVKAAFSNVLSGK